MTPNKARELLTERAAALGVPPEKVKWHEASDFVVGIAYVRLLGGR